MPLQYEPGGLTQATQFAVGTELGERQRERQFGLQEQQFAEGIRQSDIKQEQFDTQQRFAEGQQRLQTISALAPHADDKMFMKLMNEANDVSSGMGMGSFNIDPNKALANKDAVLKGLAASQKLQKTNPEAAEEMFDNVLEGIQAEEAPAPGFVGPRGEITRRATAIAGPEPTPAQATVAERIARGETVKTTTEIVEESPGVFKKQMLDETGNLIKDLGTPTLKELEGKSLINQRIGGKMDPFITKLKESAGKKFVDEQDTAQQAANSIDTMAEARAQLDSGVFTGRGANAKLEFNKFLELAGLNFFGEKVNNTQTFAATAAKLVGGVLASGMLGAGTGLSDNDVKFAKRMVAGDITVDEPSIRKILDISERAYREQIRQYNVKAADVQTKNPGIVPFDLRINVAAPTTRPSGTSKFKILSVE